MQWMYARHPGQLTDCGVRNVDTASDPDLSHVPLRRCYQRMRGPVVTVIE